MPKSATPTAAAASSSKAMDVDAVQEVPASKKRKLEDAVEGADDKKKEKKDKKEKKADKEAGDATSEAKKEKKAKKSKKESE